MICFLIFSTATLQAEEAEQPKGDYPKWFDFNVPLAVLKQAYKYDVESQKGEFPLDFVQLLAYSAAKNWGEFKSQKPCKHMDDVVKRIRGGEYLHDIAADIKMYPFYLRTYGAVLGNLVGSYQRDGEVHYGLKAFFPIAKNFGYSHSDDFGNPRSYGYKRVHLGHDMFGSTGTPIIAVEDGIVEATGWNQYGGWRVGIRSLDNKRYYYYAHLKKDTPYAQGIEKGAFVQAGDVVGYLGNTGYSTKENVANIKAPHLHFGLQIIFDESQKDGYNQIWIDAYNIVKFLSQNKAEVIKGEGGHYTRTSSPYNPIED